MPLQKLLAKERADAIEDVDTFWHRRALYFRPPFTLIKSLTLSKCVSKFNPGVGGDGPQVRPGTEESAMNAEARKLLLGGVLLPVVLGASTRTVAEAMDRKVEVAAPENQDVDNAREPAPVNEHCAQREQTLSAKEEDQEQPALAEKLSNSGGKAYQGSLEVFEGVTIEGNEASFAELLLQLVQQNDRLGRELAEAKQKNGQLNQELVAEKQQKLSMFDGALVLYPSQKAVDIAVKLTPDEIARLSSAFSSNYSSTNTVTQLQGENARLSCENQIAYVHIETLERRLDEANDLIEQLLTESAEAKRKSVDLQSQIATLKNKLRLQENQK